MSIAGGEDACNDAGINGDKGHGRTGGDQPFGNDIEGIPLFLVVHLDELPRGFTPHSEINVHSTLSLSNIGACLKIFVYHEELRSSLCVLRVGFPDRLMNKENNRAGLYNRFVKMITIKTPKIPRTCSVPTAEDDGWSRKIRQAFRKFKLHLYFLDNHVLF